MGYSRLISSFLFILTYLLSLTVGQKEPLQFFCNYTANSAYSANLKSLISSVSTVSENDYGFYNMSAGQNTDRVNAIALCRGDVKPDDCISCITTAANNLTDRCPNQKEAIIWYDKCMFRYSNRTIFGKPEDDPRAFVWSLYNVTNWDGFNRALKTLLHNLTGKAAAGDSRGKFATGTGSTQDFQAIFALVQCTPDLSETDCNNCLNEKFNDIPLCCEGRQGGRVIAPSCNFRYEIDRFYDPGADSQPAPPPSPPVSPLPPSNETKTHKGEGSNTSTTIIIIVVSVVGFIILMIWIFIFMRIKKRKPKEKVETFDEISGAESLLYDFSTIKVATDDFSDANKLGEGGFGPVYKGWLSDGREIAVKRLSKNSEQGDTEFKNEVLLVAKLQHRNLVRLLGFCLEGNERLLIYEFVPHSSLDHFIFDRAKRTQLDWETRYKIIGGIARGLLYLHEDSRLRIIHRDLKASNILLDEEMNPKISDFGMARLSTLDETHGSTKKVVGTYGYMAPEYAMQGQFSVKSDVFSFGVLLLEIVSGQKNSRFQNGSNEEPLLSYAWRNWREGTALDLVDPCLSSGSRTEMTRCIHIGLLCVQENVANRPTMASVVVMFTSHSVTLATPSPPAFLGSDGWKAESLPSSKNEVSITELYPR